MIKIVADSTCDLPPDIINALNIHIVPLYVVLGDKSLKDGIDITAPEVLDWSIANKTVPKTSALTNADVVDVFSSCLAEGDSILFITISAELSASYQVACLAAQEYDKARVRIVDSRRLSTGYALVVMRAAELAKAGYSLDDIELELYSMIPRVRTSFVLDTTLFMYRGGRCNSFTNLAAGALNIKPEIVMRDGKLYPGAKYRGKFEKSIMRYIDDHLDDLLNADPHRIFITHSFCSEAITNAVYARIESLHYFDEILITTAGCVICSHCGPGTLGILYVGKEE